MKPYLKYPRSSYPEIAQNLALAPSETFPAFEVSTFLEPGLVFGKFTPLFDCAVISTNLIAYAAPEGSDATIDLVDAHGREMQRISTILDGALSAVTVFAEPLLILSASNVRAKVITAGASLPGGFLNLALNVVPSRPRLADQRSASILAGSIFGFFAAPVLGCEIIGARLESTGGPTGADATFDLVDSSGVELSRICTIPDGDTSSEIEFERPLILKRGNYVRGKALSVGSSAPTRVAIQLRVRPLDGI